MKQNSRKPSHDLPEWRLCLLYSRSHPQDSPGILFSSCRPGRPQVGQLLWGYKKNPSRMSQGKCLPHSPSLLYPSHSFLPLILAKLFDHSNRTVRNYGSDATGAHRASTVWAHHVPRLKRLLSERFLSLCHPLLMTSISLSCCRPWWGAITRKDNFVPWLSGLF